MCDLGRIDDVVLQLQRFSYKQKGQGGPQMHARLQVPTAHTEMDYAKATWPHIVCVGPCLRRPEIDVINMEDIRDSFSKMKELKHQLGGRTWRVPNRARANAAGKE